MFPEILSVALIAVMNMLSWTFIDKLRDPLWYFRSPNVCSDDIHSINIYDTRLHNVCQDIFTLPANVVRVYQTIIFPAMDICKVHCRVGPWYKAGPVSCYWVLDILPKCMPSFMSLLMLSRSSINLMDPLPCRQLRMMLFIRIISE